MGSCESNNEVNDQKQISSENATNEGNNNSNIVNINYIIAEIDIKDNDINKDLRIINSYEESMRCQGVNVLEDENNEEEIKKCEIKINNEIIPFNYFFKFPKKGKYIIKYSFPNYLTRINYLFNECESLTNINLTNFNAKNVIDINYMFYRCGNLTNINLSNFDTQNVKNMSYFLSRCKSLIYIDLSNFNTKNVINMRDMFSWCESLVNINLSNFNTENVTDMYGMFCGCKSLINLNLSNFNTKKVTDMNLMFCGCKSLTDINLENFNTDNVDEILDMFSGCKSLKKEKIVTKDKKILGLKITKNLNKI